MQCRKNVNDLIITNYFYNTYISYFSYFRLYRKFASFYWNFIFLLEKLFFYRKNTDKIQENNDLPQRPKFVAYKKVLTMK